MCLAIPGEILVIEERHGLRFGKVQFGGITRDVCLEYQPAAQAGDYVLVHVGFAIATVDAAEVARTWDLLRELGAIEELGGSGYGGDTKDLRDRGNGGDTEDLGGRAYGGDTKDLAGRGYDGDTKDLGGRGNGGDTEDLGRRGVVGDTEDLGRRSIAGDIEETEER